MFCWLNNQSIHHQLLLAVVFFLTTIQPSIQPTILLTKLVKNPSNLPSIQLLGTLGTFNLASGGGSSRSPKAPRSLRQAGNGLAEEGDFKEMTVVVFFLGFHPNIC